MKSPILFVLLGVLALPSTASAAEQSLSLTEAIRHAAAGNVALRRERITVEIVDANLLAARGAFDFQVNGSVIFSRATQPPLTAEDLSSGFTNDLGFDIGLQRNLETGGSFRFSLQNDAIT